MVLIEIKSSKITKKGQIAIPKDIRDIEGFKEGSKIAILAFEDRVELRPLSRVNERTFTAIASEKVLAQEKAKILNQNSSKLQMAQTDGAHIALQDEQTSYKPKTFFRDGHMARNDGNSVDLDVETTEMSKNSVMFNALINANKKDTMIYRSVIDASSKIS